MQSSPETKTASSTFAQAEAQEPNQTAGRVYQCLTVAAMLLLLVTLWVF
jgi:hypothetical protein